jgi:hypothetical protein
MYISYSGWKKYKDCPFSYWHDYIAHSPLEKPDDRLGSVYGSVVGALFEDFYNQKLWQEDQPKNLMKDKVEGMVKKILRQETTPKHGRAAGVLLWKGSGKGQNPKGLYANEAELIEDVKEAVDRGFKIIKQYRLLGPRAEAEVKLDSNVGSHILGGRADFVMVRTTPHSDLCILDGKGSRHRGNYVSPKQLLWYAMLYRLRFGEMPDKLGFVYWRYAPPESMDWVEFSAVDLDQLMEEVLSDLGKIEAAKANLPTALNQGLAREEFKPKPNEDSCRFCPRAVANQCPDGIRFQLHTK